MMDRGRRKPRQLPLPRSFKVERGEHWLDRYECEAEEHEEALRKLQAGEMPFEREAAKKADNP